MPQVNFQFSSKPVAVDSGLSIALSETPKTGFVSLKLRETITVIISVEIHNPEFRNDLKNFHPCIFKEIEEKITFYAYVKLAY